MIGNTIINIINVIEGSSAISIIKSDSLPGHFIIEKVFYKRIFFNVRNCLHLSPVDSSFFEY